MNPWQILEIAPTNDKTQIKRAFAKKLKENPPDKDASLYQQIREAYNAALRLSEYVSDEDEADEDDVFEQEEVAQAEEAESTEAEESSEDENFDSDAEADYDPADDLLSEKQPSSQAFDMAEIQKLRDSMQTTENARTLSDIAGDFTVKNWHFNEEADYSFAVKLFFWIKFPVYITALIFLIVWMVSSK